MVIKVSGNTAARREILDIGNIFRAECVDLSDHTVTLQVSFFHGSVSVCLMFFLTHHALIYSFMGTVGW